MNNIVTCKDCTNLERTELIVKDDNGEHYFNLCTCDHFIHRPSDVNDVLDAHALRICDQYYPKGLLDK
jgi:hypothetical protein